MINYPLKDLVLNIDKNISYNDFNDVLYDINDLLSNTDWIAEYDIHSILYKRFLTFRNKINTDKRYDFFSLFKFYAFLIKSLIFLSALLSFSR